MNTEDMLQIAEELKSKGTRLDDRQFAENLETLERAAEEVGKSFSGSWLGYHSRVYYENFNSPPAGARFSQEWGFEDSWPIRATTGNWRESTSEEVLQVIEQRAGHLDIDAQEEEAKKVREIFDESKATVLSSLSSELYERRDDKFLEELRQQIESLDTHGPMYFVEAMRPKGKLFSRDMIAIEKGSQVPPHVGILARVYAVRQPFRACMDLSKLVRRAASHLVNMQRRENREGRIGTNVFIGHGRSGAWRDLKDFVQDRLHLPWDEFNRVPIAGVTNITRLSQMLDEAAIAFLIMTGEDEQADGNLHARLNVIHEAGLFQGRLGFERAIVLLEDGCNEFSNIQGLGQIRFPKGNIKAIFEEVRQVLEREGLLG